jgi:Recombination endonuclease VII
VKRCKKCGEVKSLNGFYRNPGGKDGRRPECKECTSAARRVWYQANREKAIDRVVAWQRANREQYREAQREYRRKRPLVDRTQHLRSTFGLSLEDYDSLLRQQGGGCAICGSRSRGNISLHVDHDHESGLVRGLLCVRCNNGLGQFKESFRLMSRAADYVDSGGFVKSRVAALRQKARTRAVELRHTLVA